MAIITVTWKSLRSLNSFSPVPRVWRLNKLIPYDSINDVGDSSIPCSTCGTPCTLRTANTVTNRGRKFYSCPAQSCSFFVYVVTSLNILVFVLSIYLPGYEPCWAHLFPILLDLVVHPSAAVYALKKIVMMEKSSILFVNLELVL